ncbi:MAG: ribonuclease P protein component [Ferruginibacter sp.]
MEKNERYTLGKNERLKSRKAIDQLFKEGKSLSLFPIRIIYQKTIQPQHTTGFNLQSGFTVSTKHFKRATDRNRTRRLMREAYRLQKNELQQTLTDKEIKLDVFFIYVGKEVPDYAIIFEKIKVAIDKLQQLVIAKNR